MGKKKRRQSIPVKPPPPSRFPLVVIVVSGYWATVIGFILLIANKSLPFYQSGQTGRPTVYLLTLWVLFYVVPVGLAFFFGLLFRPFWKNFRNVLFPIFYIAVLFSFIVAMLRNYYAEELLQQTRQARLARIEIESFRHTLSDEDYDGIAEAAEFKTRYHMPDFPVGQYRLMARVSRDKSKPEMKKIGSFEFPVTKKTRHNFVGNFKFVSDAHTTQVYDVHLELHWLWLFDHPAKTVLNLTRWAPFFRTTDWEGRDSFIEGEFIVLDSAPFIDSVTLPAPL